MARHDRACHRPCRGKGGSSVAGRPTPGVVRRANWQSLAEVKTIYSSADVVGRRTVFNIAGNHFRLIARINYRVQAVYPEDTDT